MIKIFDLDVWQEIWVTITRNKLRSILTGFGVFWGIFMMVVLIGVGTGFEGGIRSNFDGLASNACFFYSNRTSVPYKGYRKGRQWDMNNRDIKLIRERAESVDLLSPMLFGYSSDKNVVRGVKSGGYSVVGVYPAHFEILKQTIHYGRLLNNLDVDENRKVCVIGIEVYQTLFNIGENPIGSYIRVNGIYFQVVGVITPVSEDVQLGSDTKESVYIPFSTMQKAFNQGDIIHFMACTVKPGFSAKDAEEEVKTILKVAHDISPTDQKAINLFNTEELFKMFDALFSGVSILIWIVGIGALLSGIIGISNIMMVTVRERTREIGVRRALGAKPIAIMTQILSESFVLTSLFGILGLLVGLGLLAFVDNLLSAGVIQIDIISSPIIPFLTAIAALLILLVSGVFAGLMPAFRALKVKPIDAIRDE